ncbi:endonuclease/exonuclease/phosphatase family protein, partial [Ostertagia ostertagi]
MIWTRDGRAKDPRLCTTSPHLGVRQGRKKDYGRIKMHIASHNVRTLSTDSLLDVYLQQLEKIKADIIGVCETRRARAVSARWTSGEEILLGEGANNVPRTGGVGFIIKAKMVPYIISCDIISPRQTTQKLGNRTLKMVQVYAPTITAEDDEIERFYEEIETALKLKSTYTIVQGDFNAVVGSRLDDTEYLIGRTTSILNNEHFLREEKRLWTWRSSDTRTLRQIDYVLTDTPRLFADVSVIGENVITTGSDHRLLRSVILFDAKKERRVLHSQRTLVRQTFNADMYAAMIESSDLHMNTGSNIDADYEDLVGKITQAVKASSIAIEPARRRRISTETLQMMKRRARMKAEGRVQNEEYRTLCEAIRERIKCDYEGYRQMKLREAAEKRASLKAVERDIRLRQHIHYACIPSQSARTTNRPQMNEICTKFYNDLYSSKVVVARTYRNVAEEPIPEVMWEEVENAVKQIKAGKSPGCDNIRPEHLKAGGLHLFKALAE